MKKIIVILIFLTMSFGAGVWADCTATADCISGKVICHAYGNGPYIVCSSGAGYVVCNGKISSCIGDNRPKDDGPITKPHML